VIGPLQHRVHMRSSLTSVSCRAVTGMCCSSQRSLIRADTGRGVTQGLVLAGQYWRHLESC